MSHGHDDTIQTSASNNDYVRALVNAGYRWDTSAETGDSNEIRVTFVGSGFDPFQANTIGIALGQWQAVSNIQFAEPESDTPNDPQLREDVELLFALAPGGSLGNFGGYSGTPYDALTENNVVTVNGDNILIADLGRTYTRIDDHATNNGKDVFDSNGGITPAGFELIMHEIGHALGLKHPHDYGAANFPFLFPGVTQNDSSDLGDNSLNQNLFTIMSYNDATIGYDCATPMAFDIAAIQTLYGARADANSGNDTYTIPDPGTATSWRCIWDTGGIDSIRYNGSATDIIDLRPATLRDEVGGGGQPSYSNNGSTIGCGFTIAGDAQNVIPDQNGVAGVIIENAYGGSGYDGITGNDVDNVIDGGAGGDYMAGGKGNDTYSVDNTGDQVVEAAGGGTNDRVNTTLTSYTLGANLEFLDFQGPPSTGFTGTGNELDNTIQGYFGDDILDGKAGADTMRGYSGDDTYYVDNAGDVVSDTGGNDRVNTTLTRYTLGSGIEFLDYQGDASVAFRGTGNDSANTIQGYGGNDILDGKGGADLMRGYSGNDTFYVDDAGDVVEDSSGRNTVLASVDYTLSSSVSVAALATTRATGTAAIDLTGNGQAQSLRGNNGANVLDGQGGADTMIGYGGNDRYYVDEASDAVYEKAGGGAYDTVLSSVSYALRAGQEIEVLGVVDGDSTVAINLTGNEKAQSLHGNDGANRLNGMGGADTMIGYGGNDVYFVDDAGDRIVEHSDGGAGDRVLASVSYVLGTGQAVETISTTDAAGTGAIDLTGNEKAQTLYGNAGANRLDGMGGADLMRGYGGSDSYYVDDAGDQPMELAGDGTADRVWASVSYALRTGQEIEVLSTTSATGTVAIDLTGNDKAQTVYGNNGANILDGKAGADTLRGYAGADGFAFSTALGAGNVDHVVDFSVPDDTVRLAKSIFTVLSAGALHSTAFKDLGVTGAKVDGDDRILYNHTTGVLSYDADGSGTASTAQTFAVLDNHAVLTFQDFVIV